MGNGKIIGVVAVALFGAAFWVWNIYDTPAHEQAAPMPADTETQAETGAMNMSIELDSNFPDAPDRVLAVARAIIAGEEPPADMIAALSQEELNQFFSPAMPEFTPYVQAGYGHGLLRQAIVSRNLEAAKALIAAGANARFNDDEMAFMAIKMKENEDRVWWPDYELGSKFLALWLGAGGDPNAVNIHYDSTSTVLTATPSNNLEGILALLEAGADPWFKLPAHDDTSDDPYLYRSFFERIANASSNDTELSFRVALAGYYRGGTQEQRDGLMQEYTRIAEDLKYARGPEALNTLWHMKMALNEVLKALDIAPSRDIADMMSVEVPDDIGGFWLGPDMVRSPADGSHVVNNFNQLGSEMWRGR